MEKLFTKGKCLFLAYDQGLEHGPTDFNDDSVNPKRIISLAEKGKFNAFICQKGIAEKYKNEIKKLNPEKIDLLDGIQAYFKGYWVSIRKSQTEPLLRLSLEGKNRSLVESKKRELIKLIKHNL